MARSTDTQKAERLNAAIAVLAHGTSRAEAVQVLSRDFHLSRRQAYRYLEEAEAIGHPVPVGEPSIPVTFKIPRNIVSDLRVHAAVSGSTLSEIVARAIAAFLAQERGNG